MEQADYDAFVKTYGDPRTGDTRPPFTPWLPVYPGDVDGNSQTLETTSQRLAVVSPTSPNPGDNHLQTWHATLEDWSYTSGQQPRVWLTKARYNAYNPKPGTEWTDFPLQRKGVFISLVDKDPEHLANGKPQNYPPTILRGKMLPVCHFTTPATNEVIYDETLLNRPPPGFPKAGLGPTDKKQLLWDAP
jgi:hypothetical protein